MGVTPLFNAMGETEQCIAAAVVLQSRRAMSHLSPKTK